MRMNQALLEHGYSCEISPLFLDLEGGREREIDLIASKRIGNINVHFVIECKQSLLDKWVFICTRSNSGRFYFCVKHLPSVAIEVLRDKELFSHFHAFDPRTPVAHNYLCYSVANNKKGETLQIDECVHKLPKALADLASRAKGGRHLFFPVALYSGQIFAVTYTGKLIVEERSLVSYFVSFGSDAYKRVSSPP